MKKIKIRKIESVIVDLPTCRPHKLSMTTMLSQVMVIVFITTEDGIVGIGEATTIGGLSYCEESPEGMKLTIDKYISPLIIGETIGSINKLTYKISKVVQGNRIARSAIETALLDNQSKRLNIPASELLGGRITNELPVLWTLASGDTEKDIAEAQMYLDEKRHNRFKLKIGSQDIDKDVKHVGAIKKALGDKASITVDVNQAWSESQSRYGIPRLVDAGVDLIEQPVPRNQIGALKRLNQKFAVSIMADEIARTEEDIFEIAKNEAADVVALKISKSGGPFQVLKSAHVAQASGISIYGGTLLEGTVGTVASLQAFSTIECEWGTELFGPLLLTDDIVINRLEYKDFKVTIPNTPGIGVEIDMDKLNFYKRN